MHGALAWRGVQRGLGSGAPVKRPTLQDKKVKGAHPSCHRPNFLWEQFARSKGNIKHKKSKRAWDEQTNSWKRTYGYDHVNDDRDVPIIEAKLTHALRLHFR